MEKIDLTKCNNLRYRAKVDGKNDYGRICVENADSGLAFLRSDREGGYVAVWHCDDPTIQGISGSMVSDFEIVPRDPETYRDWQVGDRVKNPDAVCYIGRVIFVSGDFVAIETDGHCVCYTREELFNDGYRLVLTDIEQKIIEQKIIEEKKKYEPQDGDVCFVRTAAGNCFIFIKREHKPDEEIHSYACFDTNLWSLCPAKVSCVCDRQSIRELRLATEDEKQKLFDAMAKQGKRWDAEKKVVEDIPKPYEFKKGEPVLVRDGDKEIWRLRVYIGSIEDSKYTTYLVKSEVIDSKYRYCIPYNERTMHLLGTMEDYKEEQL